jgi:hypothetical protein
LQVDYLNIFTVNYFFREIATMIGGGDGGAGQDPVKVGQRLAAGGWRLAVSD